MRSGIGGERKLLNMSLSAWMLGLVVTATFTSLAPAHADDYWYDLKLDRDSTPRTRVARQRSDDQDQADYGQPRRGYNQATNGAPGRSGNNFGNFQAFDSADRNSFAKARIQKQASADVSASVDPSQRKPDKYVDNAQVGSDGIRHFDNGKHFDLSKISLEDAIATTNASTLGGKKPNRPDNRNLDPNTNSNQIADFNSNRFANTNPNRFANTNPNRFADLNPNRFADPNPNRFITRQYTSGNGGQFTTGSGSPYNRSYGLDDNSGYNRQPQMLGFRQDFQQSQDDWMRQQQQQEQQARRRARQAMRNMSRDGMADPYATFPGRIANFPNRRMWND